MTDEEERALLIVGLLANQIDEIAGTLGPPYWNSTPATLRRVGITYRRYQQFIDDQYLEAPPGTIPFSNVRYICVAFDRMREVRTR